MPATRFESIDVLRGIAVVWMTLFHLAFDLQQFGYFTADFYRDPFWTLQRTLIVSMFLLCSGIGQAFAFDQQLRARQFWKRWSQIAACALLVSAGSYWMFPKSFIYFGILHGIAVMLLIVRFTAGWGRWLWLAGALVFAIKLLAAPAHSAWAGGQFLNEPAFNWLGLISRKPITEDYVPLVPWLGVMWWGMAAGQWLLARRATWLSHGVPPMVSPLSWLGRWSLSWYMLHQPVLIGLLMGLAAIKK
jgi:uncharacterized membrane protein